MSAPAARPAVAELRVADDPAVWAGLGFALDDDGVARVGGVGIRPVGADPQASGIVGWVLRDGPTTDLDGLATAATTEPPAPAGVHPNGAVSIDHVVVASPDRARTSAVLDAAGLGLRRVREDTRRGDGAGRPLVQAFHRAGEVIVEVVGPPEPAGEGPASFWGLVCVLADLEGAVAARPDAFGPVRDAVQPGRRIASVRREAGSTVRIALMSA